MKNKSGKLIENKLIQALIPSALEIPKIQVLSGQLGKSSRKEYCRLYQSLDLTSYIEFSEEDILHTVNLENERDPIGGTIVWLKEDAKFDTVVLNTEEDEPSFFSGQIADDLLDDLSDIDLVDIIQIAYGTRRCTRRRRCEPLRKRRRRK